MLHCSDSGDLEPLQLDRDRSLQQIDGDDKKPGTFPYFSVLYLRLDKSGDDRVWSFRQPKAEKFPGQGVDVFFCPFFTKADSHDDDDHPRFFDLVDNAIPLTDSPDLHQENTRLNTFLLQSELHRCEAAAFLDKQVIQD